MLISLSLSLPIDPLDYSRISLLLSRHIFISLPLLYFSLLFQCIFNFFSPSSYQFILLLFSPFHFGTIYVHLQFRKFAPLEILKSMQCFEGFNNTGSQKTCLCETKFIKYQKIACGAIANFCQDSCRVSIISRVCH